MSQDRPAPPSRAPDAAETDRAGRASSLRAGATWTVLLTLVWLGLAGQADLAEVGLAATVAGATSAVGIVARRRAGAHFRPGRDWWDHGPGMVASAFRDCFVLVGALGRRLRGQPVEGTIVTLPCEVGGDGGRDTARRVLLSFGTSLQPNSYVLGFDEERQLVVVRQLVATDTPPIAASLRGRS